MKYIYLNYQSLIRSYHMGHFIINMLFYVPDYIKSMTNDI